MGPLPRDAISGLSRWISRRQGRIWRRGWGRRGGRCGWCQVTLRSGFTAHPQDNPTSGDGAAFRFFCHRPNDEDAEAWCAHLAVIRCFDLLTKCNELLLCCQVATPVDFVSAIVCFHRKLIAGS
jgi:hypothetical protein